LGHRKAIVERQKKHKWGDQVIDRLSSDLVKRFRKWLDSPGQLVSDAGFTWAIRGQIQL